MAAVRPLAIIATYNDLDIAPQVVRKLLQDEIDVHILDNWSSDGTYEALAKLNLHSIERFPASGPSRYFKLHPILRRKEDIAAQFPGRWIINQDSDEIRCSPWPGVGLSEGIARVSDAGFNAINFDVLSFRGARFSRNASAASIPRSARWAGTSTMIGIRLMMISFRIRRV